MILLWFSLSINKFFNYEIQSNSFFFLSSNNKSNNKGTNKFWGNKSGEKFDMVYTLEIILKHIEKN